MSKRPRLSCLKPKVRPLDTRTAKPAPKRVDPFYKSTAWRKLVAEVRRERLDRCEACGRSGVRLYLDHVVELADGGAPLAKSNTQLLCGSCHLLKGHRARRAREQRQ